MDFDDFYNKFLYSMMLCMLIFMPVGIIWFIGKWLYLAFFEGDIELQIYFWILVVPFISIIIIRFVLWLRKKNLISNKFENILTSSVIFPWIILLIIVGILSALGVLQSIFQLFNFN